MTRLFAYNANVDTYNQRKLDELTSEPAVYQADDSGGRNEIQNAIFHSFTYSLTHSLIAESGLYQLSKNCPAISPLTIKKGAQVMLLKNIDVEQGLVNGARGVVVSFRMHGDKQERLPVVRWMCPSGREVTRVCERVEFSIECGGKVIATRKQVPLRLVSSDDDDDDDDDNDDDNDVVGVHNFVHHSHSHSFSLPLGLGYVHSQIPRHDHQLAGGRPHRGV